MTTESDGNERKKRKARQCFIIGSKGIPAHYGGMETFVEKLTQYKTSSRIQYHVAQMGNRDYQYEYNGAECFTVSVPNIGSAKAVYYDLKAVWRCIDYCKTHPEVERPVFYVLACRIGPFIHCIKMRIQHLGGTLYVNPDGHEWMRKKWGFLVRKYWKLSEKLMVKYADILICDSKNIEKYIKSAYDKYKPYTVYIPYGAEQQSSILTDNDQKLANWYSEKKLRKKEYYLVVGRFVPENSYEVIIREFMASKTKWDLVIITTENHKLANKLEKRLHFKADRRIKFVGTVYDQELLKKIRENAYGYIHGHTVGGTNPSLVEALSSTDLNLLRNVCFNREVGQDSSLYWEETPGNLEELINKADEMDEDEIKELGRRARKCVEERYTWEKICEEYENLFLNGQGEKY